MTIVAVLEVVNHSMTRTQRRLQVFLRVGALGSQKEQTRRLGLGQRERRIDEEGASCTILGQDRVKGIVQKGRNSLCPITILSALGSTDERLTQTKLLAAPSDLER